MRKIFILAAGLLALAFSASAQQRMYLFPDFTDASVRFIGNTRLEKLRLNFDMLSQKLLYLDGETLMEITNMPMIQTVVTGDRQFMMREGMLCEVINVQDMQVLVNWRVKKVNVGSRGALGYTTQAKVEVLRSFEFETPYTITDFRKPTEQDVHSLEVWRQKNENTYFLNIGGDVKKVQYLKDLYKAYPEHAQALKAFAKANKLKMQNAEDAFKMFQYLNTLRTK